MVISIIGFIVININRDKPPSGILLLYFINDTPKGDLMVATLHGSLSTILGEVNGYSMGCPVGKSGNILMDTVASR